MGAMKNIAIDVMDLQEAACRAENEEEFLEHVNNSGWISPTEQAGRAHQASKMIAELDSSQRTALERVLEAVGIPVSTIDFPFKTLVSAH